MQEDLRTLSEQVTVLCNRFVDAAVHRARSGKQPAFISLANLAPEQFSDKLIAKYIDIIQAELMLRPEIKTAHLPQSIADFSERKAFEPLVLVTEVEGEYLMAKEPSKLLSLSRLAEVAEQAVAYVQEEAEDVFQDLTERLGLSMEEVSLLDPTYRFLAAPVPNNRQNPLSDRILDARQRSEQSATGIVEQPRPTFP